MNKNKYAYIHNVSVGDTLLHIKTLDTYVVEEIKEHRFDGSQFFVMRNEKTQQTRNFVNAAIRENMINISGIQLNKVSVLLHNPSAKLDILDMLEKNRTDNVSYSDKKFEILELIQSFLIKTDLDKELEQINSSKKSLDLTK